MVPGVDFDSIDRLAAAGGKFICYAACAAEKIENLQVIKIKIVAYYIERFSLAKSVVGRALKLFPG
jgi:hypothetical protein